MMRCRDTSCGCALTELDVAFFKNIRKTDSLEDVKCIDCLTNRKVYKAIYWKEHTQKYALFYLSPIILLLICFPLALIGIIAKNTVFASISLFVIQLLAIVFVPIILIGAFITIKDFNLDSDFRAVGSHYETTSHYDGMNIISTTKKVTDYEGDNFWLQVLLFLSFHMWAVPFWIYNNKIRLHIACPHAVKNAYLKAKESVDDATVSPFATAEFYLNNWLYKRRIKKVKREYTYLSDADLKAKLDEIKEKDTVTRIAGKKAVVLSVRNSIVVVSVKEKGEYVTKTIIGNSFVY